MLIPRILQLQNEQGVFMKQHNIIKKANDILKEVKECTFSIIDNEGYPHGATRSFCAPADMLGAYISTNTSGNLSQSIRENSKAGICVRHENSNITLLGRACIIEDTETKEKCWQDWFINYYKKGVNDPEYCLIEFKTERVSLWIDRQNIKFDTSEFMTPVSYCGLLCSTCDFAESNSCKGCHATKGNPFYGECHIAQCAIKKGYVHCGECPDMPCGELKRYSCGDDEHCDNPKGARLEILKMWK
jgi:general stress protein 26